MVRNRVEKKTISKLFKESFSFVSDGVKGWFTNIDDKYNYKEYFIKEVALKKALKIGSSKTLKPTRVVGTSMPHYLLVYKSWLTFFYCSCMKVPKIGSL